MKTLFTTEKKVLGFIVFCCCAILFGVIKLFFGTDHSRLESEHYVDRLGQIEFAKEMNLRLLESNLNIATIDWESALDRNAMTNNSLIELTKFHQSDVLKMMIAQGCDSIHNCKYTLNNPVGPQEVINTLLETQRLKDQMVQAVYQYEVGANQVILDYETNFTCLASFNDDVDAWLHQKKKKRDMITSDIQKLMDVAKANADRSIDFFKEYLNVIY